MNGKTTAGFEYVISDSIKDDFEFIDMLRKADTDAFKLIDAMEYALGSEQLEKLKEFCRDENGFVSSIKMRTEFISILSSNKEAKK